jgi:ubiquinone/menaquinone biosynthesis C-methylase UbiE
LLGRETDKEWEKFGREDPYYGVMTLDKFHKKKLDEKSLEEFFTSGRDHVEFVMDTIRTSIDPVFSPSRVLDFGCGVGRCAIPLASVCPVVIGVDISQSMVDEARKNCKGQSIGNLEFIRSDDDLSNLHGNFALIHSSFVFQHIPVKRGEKILKRLVHLLSDHGVAVLDFLIHRDVSYVVKKMGFLRKNVPFFHNIANLLYGHPFSQPLMEKNVYDLNRIVKILYENGCGNLHLKTFRNFNQLDAILFFQKKRESVPHESFVADVTRDDI